MRAAPVPGTITALFLYQDAAEGNDEIDVEIVNVPPARIILATWVGGEITNRAELPLPFDPRRRFPRVPHRLPPRHRGLSWWTAWSSSAGPAASPPARCA
jgi:hypothetical protein